MKGSNSQMRLMSLLLRLRNLRKRRKKKRCLMISLDKNRLGQSEPQRLAVTNAVCLGRNLPNDRNLAEDLPSHIWRVWRKRHGLSGYKSAFRGFVTSVRQASRRSDVDWKKKLSAKRSTNSSPLPTRSSRTWQKLKSGTEKRVRLWLRCPQRLFTLSINEKFVFKQKKNNSAKKHDLCPIWL